MKFDDYIDCKTIVLPDIPPDIELIKGRIICVEEEHLSPECSTTHLKNKKLAVIILSNISQGSRSSVNTLLYSQAYCGNLILDSQGL